MHAPESDILREVEEEFALATAGEEALGEAGAVLEGMHDLGDEELVAEYVRQFVEETRREWRAQSGEEEGRYAAQELRAFAFPNCASKCGVILHLGAGECKDVCPHKFTREGEEELSQRKVWETAKQEGKATLPWWNWTDGVCEEHLLPQVPCPVCEAELFS